MIAVSRCALPRHTARPGSATRFPVADPWALDLHNPMRWATMLIRPLTAIDAARYLPLRLRGLQEHPEAFASAFEEEQQFSLEMVAPPAYSSPQPNVTSWGPLQ